MKIHALVKSEYNSPQALCPLPPPDAKTTITPTIRAGVKNNGKTTHSSGNAVHSRGPSQVRCHIILLGYYIVLQLPFIAYNYCF